MIIHNDNEKKIFFRSINSFLYGRIILKISVKIISIEVCLEIIERINAPGISGILNRIERNEGDILLMPQGYKLQNCEINKIKSWINQGYLNN